MSRSALEVTFPVDPLDEIISTTKYRRRLVRGILESYNSNYDFLVEAMQNAVDAVEDAELLDLSGPREIRVYVNLQRNSFAVLDTGVGMSAQEMIQAYTPHFSGKTQPELIEARGPRQSYRGYKGVGLTFLAYGTDFIRLHSIKGDSHSRTRMQYGRAWAQGERGQAAQVEEDNDPSPLDDYERGTYVELRFSPDTRPRSLAHLGQPRAWPAIIRTRTALGQILLDREPLTTIDASVHVVGSDSHETLFDLEPIFLYPHLVDRTPPFRFLDALEYHQEHEEYAAPPRELQRQDGVHLSWDTQRIGRELTSPERDIHQERLEKYKPQLYGFLPYQASVWRDMNGILTGVQNRDHLHPGLVIAINRQRIADVVNISATRYESLSRNVLVIVHFDDARPDQGRKTVQEDVMALAQAAANRAVQYLARQRTFLRPAGERPTPLQRQIERNHDEWIHNVRIHEDNSPLHSPPLAYISEPLTEQDVVGLFHELCSLGVFPGIRIYATSQSHTYDGLVKFECAQDTPGLLYQTANENPLGISHFVCGDEDTFETGHLTLEFKSNLDGLIDEFDDADSPKSYHHVDIAVCWGQVDQEWDSYDFRIIDGQNIEERKFPGVTHILHRNSESHIIQTIFLSEIIEMLQSGRLSFMQAQPGG